MTIPSLRRLPIVGAGCGIAVHLPASWLLIALIALIGLLPAPGLAQVGPAASAAGAVAAPVAKPGAQRVDAVEAELVADVARAVPGQPFRLGLRLKHDPDWHTYWRNPGDSGLPTRFEPAGPAGASYGEIAWPAPRRLAIGDLANYGYEGEVILSRQVTLPADPGASTVRFDVLAQWLVCKDVCIPGEAALALELPLGARAEPGAASTVALFDEGARQAPDAGARREAGWWQGDAEAVLLLPAGVEARQAEFFPYFEGVIRPAAAQSLVEAGGRDAVGETRLLALRLQTLPAPALPESPAGLLLVDGRPLEIGLQALATAPAAGKVVSVAQVVPSAAPASGGLLDRLRGGAASVAGAVAPATAGAAGRPFPSPAVGAASGTLMVAVAAALLGGLILNLMPCVFPVIGLKVLSFSQAAGGEATLARRHAWTFSGGVVLSFVVMGLVLLALRSAGEAAGWGFQMQSPVFVGAMALLFVLIGLNLFGVFETGLALTRLDLPAASRVDAASASGARSDGPAPGANRGGHRLGSSFCSGVIAVLVATPCTAPFMGSAVGYTISAPPGQTLLVFAALGIGMAAPYLVLGSAPWLLRRLPRPGPWLPVFKQLLAFPMLATAAWLAWVLTLQAGADGLLRLLMSAILLAFAAWVYGCAQSARFSGRSAFGRAALAAALLAGVATASQLAQIGPLEPAAAGAGAAASGGQVAGRMADSNAGGAAAAAPGAAADAGSGGGGGAVSWQPWSANRVSQALAQGRPVLVDFTAAWCISCQANKKFVLEREVLRRAFDANRVVLLRADWTSRDPAITAELARFGRNGVPLYLVYPSADEPPLMLPELLTVDIVLAALGGGR